MSKERRLVQVMHKCETIYATKAEDRNSIGGLAVGKTFRFNSGDAYTVQKSGAVVNANPKPYRNKAERKRYMAARRNFREAEKAADADIANIVEAEKSGI